MQTTLVVLAAGLGSRFGGLKQLEPLTSDGKILLDFSIDDALTVGFDRVVFVIRQELREQFDQTIGNRISQKVAVNYVIQESFPNRTKPLGTGHALICCWQQVNTPFAVINADDYYGIESLRQAHDFLQLSPGKNGAILYSLGNTTSPNGKVNRGVCQLYNGFLSSVTETRGINFDCTVDGLQLDEHSLVSMNLWAFSPKIFPLLQSEFQKFLQCNDLQTDEFVLTDALNNLICQKRLQIQAIATTSKWVGMTYKEDLPIVKKYFGLK